MRCFRVRRTTDAVATPAELRKRAAANDGKHAFNPVQNSHMPLRRVKSHEAYVSYDLNSLKRAYLRDYIGDYYRDY